ncbi:MAG: tetratricopeptide repeat protein [Flavobacteriaceae bacterium]
MKQLTVLFTLFFSLNIFAQSPRLARKYYQSGQYEKAVELYKSLHKKHAYRSDYFKFLIGSYQQLEKYIEAQKIILEQLQKFPNQLQFNIELGYNYTLQNQNDKAKIYYDIALKAVDINPNLGYNTGKTFQDNNLLDYALKAYKSAMKSNPKLNFNLQVSLIYGEQGAINKMFDSFLNMVNKDPSYTMSILRYVGNFITEDTQNANNILLKNLLIQRVQNNPNSSWNILLSWLFMQEKKYNKAFIQEKAIYRRNPTNLNRLVDLGKITFNAKDYTTSQHTFEYILKNAPQINLKIYTQLYLLKIKIALGSSETALLSIQSGFKNLLTEFGFKLATLGVQKEYALFLTYKLNQPQEAINLLKKSLGLNLNINQRGILRLQLADVYVFSNQLNKALISYSQVKTSNKNSVLAQKATFKIAQTSYFKGDFKWAQTQLKVLKSETSQLIANDALKLSLLISNNDKEGKPEALKLLAKAELLTIQNKDLEALDSLQVISTKFNKYTVAFYALFKQAEIYEKQKSFDKAEQDYLKILALDKNNILADDACFKLAKLYQNKLNDTNKAAAYYEKIIFDYPASIYLVEARKIYRTLKPDLIN